MQRNIRDANKYQQTWWDWTPYNECFRPTPIRITDIDGCIERHGDFLFVETKLPGTEIPKGQAILFDHLVKIPNFNVMVLWGEPDRPQEMQFWGPFRKRKTDQEDVKRVIRRWFELANRKVIHELTERELVVTYLQKALEHAQSLKAKNDEFGAKLEVICLRAQLEAAIVVAPQSVKVHKDKAA